MDPSFPRGGNSRRAGESSGKTASGPTRRAPAQREGEIAMPSRFFLYYFFFFFSFFFFFFFFSFKFEWMQRGGSPPDAKASRIQRGGLRPDAKVTQASVTNAKPTRRTPRSDAKVTRRLRLHTSRPDAKEMHPCGVNPDAEGKQVLYCMYV